MKNIFRPLLVLVGTLLAAAPAQAIEEPTYTVARTYTGFEVRDYASYRVAEVTVPGPESEAGNQGFRVLAAYIFGENAGEQTLSMTAPVFQTPKPAKIAMTAPVMQAASDAGFIVQFKMPAAYTLETLPRPLDERIRLLEVPEARHAVIGFSGFWSQANYDEHLERLRALMAKEQLQALGAPVYARYNAPFVPWFLRRNEIWIPTP